jgi:hypothetical protein
VNGRKQEEERRTGKETKEGQVGDKERYDCFASSSVGQSRPFNFQSSFRRVNIMGLKSAYRVRNCLFVLAVMKACLTDNSIMKEKIIKWPKVQAA